jgi:hypothetical protein
MTAPPTDSESRAQQTHIINPQDLSRLTARPGLFVFFKGQHNHDVITDTPESRTRLLFH